jgi:hypothetical protein
MQDVKAQAIACQDGHQSAQSLHRAEASRPPCHLSQIDDLCAEQRVAAWLWLLMQSHDEQMVLSSQSLDQP